jgi:DNA repair photolyase
MKPTPIISASRRTDLPRFYPDYLAEKLDGARNKLAVVLWTKDPVNTYAHSALSNALSRHHVVALVTITSMGRSPIEPGVPPWEEATENTRKLVDFLGRPEAVRVRFDPLVYFDDGTSNIEAFPVVAKAVRELGIRHIITSFLCLYPQVKKGLVESGIRLIDPPLDRKLADLKKMAQESAELGIALHSCCSPTIEGVRPSSCISAEWLSGIYGVELDNRKDPAQRKTCNCLVSRDIGSYSQRCVGGCIYCYAQKGGTLRYLRRPT